MLAGLLGIISIPSLSRMWGTTTEYISPTGITSTAHGLQATATGIFSQFLTLALFVIGFILGALILKYMLNKGAVKGVKTIVGGFRSKRPRFRRRRR